MVGIHRTAAPPTAASHRCVTLARAIYRPRRSGARRRGHDRPFPDAAAGGRPTMAIAERDGQWHWCTGADEHLKGRNTQWMTRLRLLMAS